jgi:hypothetical protein
MKFLIHSGSAATRHLISERRQRRLEARANVAYQSKLGLTSVVAASH